MLAAFLLVCCSTGATVEGWNAKIAEATRFQTEGAYAEAEKTLHDALLQAESFGPRDHRLAVTLNNLGALYRIEGKYQLAESHYSHALAIWSETDGPVASALNNLAVLLVEQGRYADAEVKYRKAIAIEERKPGTSHPVLAAMLTNLATLSFNQGRYSEGEALDLRSFAIAEQSGLTIASTLNNLAVLYRAQARYSDAERLLIRALNLRERTLGPRHPEIAKILTNLADLYMYRRQRSKAESA